MIDRPRPCPGEKMLVMRMLTRNLFAVANLLVVVLTLHCVLFSLVCRSRIDSKTWLQFYVIFDPKCERLNKCRRANGLLRACVLVNDVEQFLSSNTAAGTWHIRIIVR